MLSIAAGGTISARMLSPTAIICMAPERSWDEHMVVIAQLIVGEELQLHLSVGGGFDLPGDGDEMVGERMVDRYVVAQLQRELCCQRRAAKHSGQGDRCRSASINCLRDRMCTMPVPFLAVSSVGGSNAAGQAR